MSHPYNGIPLSNKNKLINDIQNNLDAIKGIMLNERSQSQKITYGIILYI